MTRKRNPSIRVYTADVTELLDEQVFAMRYSEVSSERRMKIDKLRREEDKRLSLGAECLLMKACEDFGISYHDSEVLTDSNGKPYFRDIPIHFNLSHSGDRVMCIMGNHPVGCDVERVQPVKDSLAKKCLSAEEYAVYEACETAAEQAELFFRYWTCKESYLKCTGIGLRVELNTITIADINGKPYVKDVPKTRYKLHSETNGDGYWYAWCEEK